MMIQYNDTQTNYSQAPTSFDNERMLYYIARGEGSVEEEGTPLGSLTHDKCGEWGCHLSHHQHV
jgi:hypothetical protein